MIIKSMGRKARTQAYGRRGQRAVNAFRALAAYMNRGIYDEEGRAILWHNFPGGEEMDEDALVAEFEANARRLRERKNGNVLYHEILSFSAGHALDRDRLARHIADVGQEYLRRRAPEQLAYGVIHLDTGHIHLHLMVSANRVRSADRVRLSKADFADIQRETERYLLAKYPELAQTRIYDRDAAERAQARAEKVKGQAHEQAMKIRTGAASRKDELKMHLHHLFERAGSVAELHRLAEKEGLSFYQRGKSVGVIEHDPSGTPKKHRLATLGVDLHYARTLERLTRHHDAKSGQTHAGRSPTQDADADPMKPAATPSKIIESVDETAKDIGSSKAPETSRAKEILDEELRFGKEVAKDFIFGPDRPDRRPNHEKPPETREERRLRLLREAKERRQARDQDKDRGDDHERWHRVAGRLVHVIRESTELVIATDHLLFHYYDMNSKQAKAIPIPDFLAKLGFTAVRVRWVDHWYLSPFRDERTPSFKVDVSKNVWYDHGIGAGGTIIDLVQTLQQTQDVSRALAVIADTMGAYTPSLFGHETQKATRSRDATTKAKPELLSVWPIQSASLEQYLTTRAIPVDLARLYFEEARYRIDDQGAAREYRALAFANDAGGYELRSPSFKGTLGTKAVRFIPATTLRPDAAVFEGAMDFVSALAHYGRERSDANVLVLNSTALAEKGLERLQAEGLHTALTYFDHDEAGRLATRRFEEEGARYGVRIVRDMASIYEGYGDFNDYLVAQRSERDQQTMLHRER